jgi:hypothetical protein
VEYGIWLGECGTVAPLRHRARQRSPRRASGSKWLLLSALVDKSFSKRRGRHHRLVHAACGGGIALCFGRAWQPVGRAEDRREFAGANTFVCREMLAGLRRDHCADVGRELFDPAKPDKAVSEPPLGSNISSDGRRGHDRDARAQFPSARSPGVFGVRFTSSRDVDQCSLRNISERAAVEYCAGFEPHDLQCSHC